MPTATPSWNSVRVHGKWVNQDGSMKPGSWKLTMPFRVTNATDDVIIPLGLIGSGSLNVTAGLPSLDIQAPCSDDPDNFPVGVQPVLEVTFLDAPGERYLLDTPVSLSGNAGGIDLATVILTDTLPIPAEVFIRGVAGGLAELDAQGDVVDASGAKVKGSGAALLVVPTATASATLAAAKHTPVDATSGAKTMTLPTTAAAGVLLSVEKTDATTNAVTITGTLRGVAASSIPLTSQYEARTFLSEGSGSWRPVSDHRTAASLAATIAGQVGTAITSEVARTETTYVKPGAVGRAGVRGGKFAVGKFPVTSATLPTFTVGTAQAQANALTVGSAIASPVAVPFGTNQAKFNVGGGPAFTQGSAYYSNGLLFSTDAVTSLWRIEWMTDSPDYEYAVRDTNGTPANHRLMVDGEWVITAQVGAGTGSRFSYRVNYGVRKVRRYVLWIENLSFGGLVIGPTDSLFPPIAKATRAMFFGDSYVLGTGADRFLTSWATQASQLLGFDDPYFNGKSGTGYSRVVSGRRFIDRIPDTVTPYAPDLLIVMGGYNDNTVNVPGLTAATVQADATAFYAALASALPNMPVVVFGKQTSRTAGAEDQSFSNAIKTAALAAPNVKRFVDLVTDPWIVGTGHVGATTGTGNADVLIATDGAHPSQIGHDYYAARCSEEIGKYLLTA